MSSVRVGLLTSLGCTLDAFFPLIAAQWRDQGATVFTAAGTGVQMLPARDHDVLEGLTRRPSVRNVVAPRSIASWVNDRELDIVVTNTATASGLARLRRQRVPVIYFCHGLHWAASQGRRRSPWEVLERRLLHHTDGVVVLNDFDERWFATRGESIPRLRLPYGVGLDTQQYRRTEPVPHSGGLRVVWIGEFTRRKRPMDALRVAELLRSRGVPFSLTMAGDGPELERCEHEIGQRGLDDHVTLLHHVEVAPHLVDADVLLHTASWEGLPRVVLEAMAVGRPTVGYDVKGVQDLPVQAVGRPGECALLVDALARMWQDRGALPPLPEPSCLSYRQAADDLLGFVDEISAVPARHQDVRA